MPEGGAPDSELAAIEKVIGALAPLDSDARTRVMAYAFDRLRMNPIPVAPTAAASHPAITSPSTEVRDIRSLRDQKSPRSANEMATLVAYYLSETAPLSERKTAIAVDDVSKYFKQANYPLPRRPDNTLVNAKNAGYLDLAGRGLYKLSPVGYNLVTQTLPAGSGERAKSVTLKAQGRTARNRVGRKKGRA